jgi:hypothetical protein
LVGGTNGASITRSYSTGLVTKQVKEKRGGFIGSIADTSLKADYWDINTSSLRHGSGHCSHEKRECDKIEGLADDQLKASLPEGFDPTIWAQSPSINNGYPYLLNNPPPQ